MRDEQLSIRMFERAHARDRLAEDARALGEDHEARLLGAHLAAEREAQRVMAVLAVAAVAALLGALLLLVPAG